MTAMFWLGLVAGIPIGIALLVCLAGLMFWLAMPTPRAMGRGR